MEDLSEIFQDVVTTSFDVNSKHWVDVIYIKNPHDFFVRPSKYRTFVEKIESKEPQARPARINHHDVIIYKMKHFGTTKYARGKICSIVKEDNERKYTILAIDYGCLDLDVPERYIFSCENEYLNLLPLAQSCQLALCSPIGKTTWSKEAIDAFKEFVGNERAMIIVKEKTADKLIVELRNSNPDDIATLMAYTEYSTFGFVHAKVNRLSSATPAKLYYTFKNLKINDTLKVRVQSGSSLKGFYVAEVNDYINYIQESTNVSFYARKQPSLPPEKMTVGENLLAWSRSSNTRDRYERAVIKKVTLSNEKAIVHIVDWGKEEEVNIGKMKTMTEKCLSLPVLAIYCSAEESQVWDNGLHRFLYPGFEFLITIKQLGKGFESPNIVNISPISMLSTNKPRERRH